MNLHSSVEPAKALAVTEINHYDPLTSFSVADLLDMYFNTNFAENRLRITINTFSVTCFYCQSFIYIFFFFF